MVKICFAKLIEALDVTSAFQQEDVQDWLLQAEKLVITYPNTAGSVKSSLEAVKKYSHGEKSTAELWTPEARVLWKKWGKYEIGSLTYCQHGHPYPTTKLLFRGCPECGRFFDPTTPVPQPDYESKLDKEKFMEHLRKMMGTR